jgi:hypothetical protein
MTNNNTCDNSSRFTELRINGCNALLTPVLQVDNKFYLRHELVQNLNLIKDIVIN